ncbi:hypothetical protein [Acetobacter estunensis]|uniref:hypothetical protein n=1 Tax=Acetobacter estunensis TaxID=104097 RepID=UPI001C2CF931|nr:hypothetical protein [Acetobacter estunensis]MBV1835619.1 hypothetical protein [Acetobacter estunensis]MBV1836120.1 hypothetical protein [Acetobacter estunensis]
MRSPHLTPRSGIDPLLVGVWASILLLSAMVWGLAFEMGRDLGAVIWSYVLGLHFNAIVVVLMALMVLVLVEKGRS